MLRGMTIDFDDPDRDMVDSSVATRQSELEGTSRTEGASQDICHLKRATVDAKMLKVPTVVAQPLHVMLRNLPSLVALIAFSLLSKVSKDGDEYYCG